MKGMEVYSLTIAVLLLVVVNADAADVSALPEEAATPRSREGWGRVLTCILQGGGRVCALDGVYREAENWLDTATEFRSLALAEMQRKPDSQKGVLDYVGEVATFSVGRFVKYFIVGVKDADVYQAKEAGGRSMAELRPNDEAPPGSQNFNAVGYTTRLVHLKTKKTVLLKFYILAKLFIYGFIAKAKVAIVMFKVFLVLKLKFLALAVIHTLIALAKLNFQYKTQHMPEKMVSSGHEVPHYGIYHQQDYGGAYSGAGIGSGSGSGQNYRGL